jgi:hypothetical protein
MHTEKMHSDERTLLYMVDTSKRPFGYDTWFPRDITDRVTISSSSTGARNPHVFIGAQCSSILFCTKYPCVVLLGASQLQLRLRAGEHLFPSTLLYTALRYNPVINRADNVIRVYDFLEPGHGQLNCCHFMFLAYIASPGAFTTRFPRLQAAKENMIVESLYAQMHTSTIFHGKTRPMLDANFKSIAVHVRFCKSALQGALRKFIYAEYFSVNVGVFMSGDDAYLVFSSKGAHARFQAQINLCLHEIVFCTKIRLQDVPWNGYLRFVPFVDQATYSRMYCNMSGAKDAWLAACM